MDTRETYIIHYLRLIDAMKFKVVYQRWYMCCINLFFYDNKIKIVQGQMFYNLWVSMETFFTNCVFYVVTINRRSTYYLIFDYKSVLGPNTWVIN